MWAMAALSFLTFSLDKSLAFGLAAYFLHSIYEAFGHEKSRKPEWLLGLIAAALCFAIAYSA
jgi:hypothetical protein